MTLNLLESLMAGRPLRRMRNNPDYSNMSQKDLVRAYLQGYAVYQAAAADRGYALRKLDNASPREEAAARRELNAAAAVAAEAEAAYDQIFPLLTEETKQKYLTMRAVAYQRADGTSSIQSAPQDVSRVRAMSRRNPSEYWKKNIQKALKAHHDRSYHVMGDIYADRDDRDMSGLDLTKADLVVANLYGANLSGANLFAAKLTRATLTRADLSGANLSYANLYAADLTNANLSGADLTRAILPNAYLVFAVLTDANLSDAVLTDANLYGAYLIGANLTNANMKGAILTNAHMKGAILTNAIMPDGTKHK